MLIVGYFLPTQSSRMDISIKGHGKVSRKHFCYFFKIFRNILSVEQEITGAYLQEY